MSDKGKNLVIRAITGALFVVVMIACFLRAETMMILFAIITGMTIWEYTGLANHVPEVTVNRLITTVAGVYFFFAIAGKNCGLIQSNGVFLPYVLTIVYLLISELYMKTANAVNDMAYTCLSQLYIALPLSMINVLAFREDAAGIHYSYILPMCVFILLWINDTGAYCSGSLFGKHKLFPRISPGKTWEGSIGGGIIVLIVSGLIGYFQNQGDNISGLSILQWIGLGLVVVVFGTWGDLVESLMKRTFGIKDSGHILPGHGGMLDRFDSSLLAIPAAVIYIYSLQLFLA